MFNLIKVFILVMMCLGVFSNEIKYSVYDLPSIQRDSLNTKQNTSTHTCAVLLKTSRRQISSRRLCSATVVSQTEIVTNPSCLNNKFSRSMQLVCNGGVIDIPLIRSKNTGFKNLSKIVLPRPLPILPLNIALEDNDLEDYKECRIETPQKSVVLKLNNNYTLEDKEIKTIFKNGSIGDIGSSIICMDKKNDKHIVALQTGQNTFEFVKNFKEDVLTLDDKLHIEVGNSEGLASACKGTGTCLENISKETKDLTREVLDILDQLNQDYKDTQNQDPQTQEDLLVLHEQFTEIRLQCQKVKQEIIHEKTQQVDTGFWSATMGHIESGAISLINTASDIVSLDYDILYNSFKGVDIIADNLTEKEMKAIYENVSRNHSGSNIEKIQDLTHKYSQVVIEKISNQMEIHRHQKEEKDKFTASLFNNYKKCLDKTDSKSKVLECADLFSNNAGIMIGKKELDNQLIDNFEELFKGDPQTYSKLKNEAKKTYYNCITQYFDDKSGKQVEMADKAKACVYESIFTAYKITREKMVADMLQPLVLDSNRYKNEFDKIMEKSSSCHYGQLINSPRNLTKKQYDSLSKITINNFKSHINDCVESLSIEAGKHITRATLETHQDVISNITDRKVKKAVIDKIMDNDYQNCIKLQDENLPTTDPQACKDYLSAVTTLEVSNSAIRNAVDSMYETMPGFDTTQLKNSITQKIRSCEGNVKETYSKLILTQKSPVDERAILDCMSKAITTLASKATSHTIENILDQDPIYKAVKKEVLSNKVVKSLAQKTANCFREEIARRKTVSEFSEDLESIKSTCVFNTEKVATKEIALITIKDQLGKSLENKQDAQKVYENYATVFKEKVQGATTPLELESVVSDIVPDLSLNAAKKVIPSLTREYLSEFEVERQQQVNESLISKLQGCIENVKQTISPQNYSSAIDICVNEVTSSGYNEISSLIIEKSIDTTLGKGSEESKSIRDKSRKRVRVCSESISTALDRTSYSLKVEQCLVDEVFILTTQIPKEAMSQYHPLLRSNLTNKQMRESIDALENFYIKGQGSIPDIKKSKELVSYAGLLSCLVARRYEARRDKLTKLSQVQELYTMCTDSFEEDIKSVISTNFAKEFSSDDKSSKLALLATGQTLVQLSGKSDETTKTSGEKGQKSSVKEQMQTTKELMNMVGEKIANSCSVNATKCLKKANQTKKMIERQKQKNEELTGAQLSRIYIDSPSIDFVIDTEFGQTLKQELLTGLKDFKDKDSILENAIDRITNQEMIETLLQSQQGKELKSLIKEAIKEDKLDDLVTDKRFLEKLSNTLVEDTSNNSFTDQLLMGIVQPMLNEQRDSSSGLFGIFKNTKVSLGRLFGIVKGKNFKWEKIRNTSSGKKAQEYFAKELFSPVIKGENLDKIDTDGRSLMDKKVKELEAYIIEGLKEL